MPPTPVTTVTIQLDAGNAAMVDLGKMLGPLGVPAMEVKRRYDQETAAHAGDVVPAVITVFDDRSWDLRLKTPPTSFLIRRAMGAAGSSRPGHENGRVISRDDLRAIALRKLPDLNTSDVDAAMRQIEGTARSMGVRVAS